MDLTLTAKKRNTEQKAKALRKSGWVPGSVYGKGQETLHIQIPHQTLKNFLSKHAHKLELNVEGEGTFLVGIEEVQRGHLGDKLEHISFKSMKVDEKTTLTIEVHLEGKAAGQTEGGVVNHLLHEITVKGYPQELPDSITVNISELGIGDLLHVGDITSHYNFEFLEDDHNKVIAKCQHAKIIEEPIASEAEETTAAEDPSTAESDKEKPEGDKQAA